MIKYIRNALQNWVLRYVCNTLTFNEFITARYDTVHGKKVLVVMIAGKQVSEDHAHQLIEEAKMLKKLTVFSHINDSLRSKASDDLVNRSKHVDDMTFAKAMLYTITEQEKIVDHLAGL